MDFLDFFLLHHLLNRDDDECDCGSLLRNLLLLSWLFDDDRLD